jgi:outer membrane biosynthesis protein TonB
MIQIRFASYPRSPKLQSQMSQVIMNQAFCRWLWLLSILVWMPAWMVGQANSPEKRDREVHPSSRSKGRIKFRVPPPQPDADTVAVQIVEELPEIPVSPPRDSIPGPMEFVLNEREARCINLDSVKAAIGYPSLAKEKEIEGRVIVRVLVDRQGNYNRHIRIKDPNPILTDAVEAKIANLHFQHAMHRNEPVWEWVTIPFDFRLLK